MKKINQKKLRLIGLIITPVSFIMFLVSGIAYYKTEEFLKTAKSTTGKVIEIVEVRGQGTSKTYSPVFSFSLGQENYVIKSSVGSSQPQYRVNDKVGILYTPNNPNEAKINSWSTLWGLSTALCIIGITNLILGTMFLIATRKKAANQSVQSTAFRRD